MTTDARTHTVAEWAQAAQDSQERSQARRYGKRWVPAFWTLFMFAMLAAICFGLIQLIQLGD